MEIRDEVRISEEVEFSIDGRDVLVKTPFKVYKLSGPDVEHLLIEALPFLAEGISVRSLCDKLKVNDTGKLVDKIINPLLNHCWLVNCNYSSKSTSASSLQASALTSLGLNGIETVSKFSTRKIAVIGLSEIAFRSAEALKHYFSQVDVFLPDATDAIKDSAFVKRFSVDGLDRLISEATNYDFTIIFETKENLHFERELNKLANDAGARVMFAKVIGYNAVIGPTIIPGKTGCLECIKYRELNNSSYSRELMQFYGGRQFGRNPSDGASVDFGALNSGSSIIATEVVKFMLLDEVLDSDMITLDMPQTFDAVLDYNSYTYTISINRFLKNPRCPVCGKDLYCYPEVKPWMKDYTYPEKTSNSEVRYD